jgi:hypothetical protein
VTRRSTALVLALLALAAAGCGGDDEQAEAPPDPPELTIPRTTPEPAETQATGTTETTAPATPDDPATAPLTPGEGDGTGAPPARTAPDGPENDTAPPAGSPAERFERECDENPAACG